MKTSLIALFSLFILSTAYSQKLKGNKIVSTEELNVEGFHTIEIYEDFEVTLDERMDNIVRVKTDSNLHEAVDIIVRDSILTIKTNAEIRSSKELAVEILYTTGLRKIILHDKVNLKSLTPVKTKDITLEPRDNSEMFLTVDANTLNYFGHGKSETELHVSAKRTSYEINENAKIEGIITSDSLKIDLYQKGTAKLEGDIQSLEVRADNNTNFYGEKLTSKKTILIAESDSDCYVFTKEEIIIDGRDKAEIYILGQPKIIVNRFSEEATLYKKKENYSPGFF